MAERDTTYPHDYRSLFAGTEEERPTIVGGQAVNLWAIVYLDRADPASASPKYGSHDLDIVSSRKALAFLKTLPDWKFTPTPLKHFNVGVTAKLQGIAGDGRLLLVEVLHSVAGLDTSDLQRFTELTSSDGTIYRVLDPVVMLKAKAYNVRKFKQDDNPPRHDRAHLEMIAKCLPEYLLELERTAVRLQAVDVVAAKEAMKEAADAVSAAFAVLSDRATATMLRALGIPPESLMPSEFKDSPIPKIANACKHQMPRVLSAGME